jgi:hypothetical protein
VITTARYPKQTQIEQDASFSTAAAPRAIASIHQARQWVGVPALWSNEERITQRSSYAGPPLLEAYDGGERLMLPGSIACHGVLKRIFEWIEIEK